MGKIIQIGIAKLKHSPIDSVELIEVVTGKGIKGDRKFQDNNAKDQQLTLIESENIDYYNKKYNSNFSYLDFRRNLITKNIKLNDLVGKEFFVGNVKLKAHDLCRPCKYLQEKLKQSNIIKEFLLKGGIRCEILSDGKIVVGDDIKTKI